MTILILNWKDLKHPQAGGAEVLTHELAKRLVKSGHKVILFVSHFAGSKKNEIIDGVNVIRDGKPDLRALHNSVHYKAYRYYKKNLEGKVDMVIDEPHGMPFFAKFYVQERVIALICEVADTIWFRMFSFPWSFIGWIMERFYLHFYKSIRVLTISESTKKELVSCGFNPRNITILPMGVNRINTMHIKKEKKPTVIFVGRLNKMKGVEDAIKATSIASKAIDSLQLWVVGKGEDEFVSNLKNLAEDEKIDVIFWNHVTQQKKFELMRRAHAIVVPSLREGFGLIVPEAGSVGTPAVVYDVHGLRDTVVSGVNGIRVDVSPEAIAGGIINIFDDKRKYQAMCVAAKKLSVQYNWDNTAKKALAAIKNEL